MQTFFEISASNAGMVVVLAAGVALLGRIWKHPPALHLLWILVLVKFITPPVTTLSMPESVRSLCQLPVKNREEPLVKPEAKSPVIHNVISHETVDAAESQPVFEGDRPMVRTVINVPVASPAAETPVVRRAAAIDWLMLFAWTWGIGIAALTSFHAYRIFRFRHMLRFGEKPTSAIMHIAERAGRRLGLRRVPEIRMLPLRVSPLVWFLGGRPRVYLPADLFAKMDEDAQAAILAHELAHVRRGDHWIRLLELAITTLFWWHPVVWWSRSRLRELEEVCCDVLVVGLSPESVRSYASALVDTLHFISERAVAAPVGATAARSFLSLSRRITMLNSNPTAFRLTFGRLALILAAASFPMAVAFAVDPPAKEDGKKEATLTFQGVIHNSIDLSDETRTMNDEGTRTKGEEKAKGKTAESYSISKDGRIIKKTVTTGKTAKDGSETESIVTNRVVGVISSDKFNSGEEYPNKPGHAWDLEPMPLISGYGWGGTDKLGQMRIGRIGENSEGQLEFHFVYLLKDSKEPRSENSPYLPVVIDKDGNRLETKSGGMIQVGEMREDHYYVPLGDLKREELKMGVEVVLPEGQTKSPSSEIEIRRVKLEKALKNIQMNMESVSPEQRKIMEAKADVLKAELEKLETGERGNKSSETESASKAMRKDQEKDRDNANLRQKLEEDIVRQRLEKEIQKFQEAIKTNEEAMQRQKAAMEESLKEMQKNLDKLDSSEKK